MISRYQHPLIEDIFSDEKRIYRWWEHTVQFVQRRVDAGVAPPEAAEQIRAAGAPDAATVQRREHATGHEVVAFLAIMDDRLDEAGQTHLHYGLTSSDLVDNAHFDALFLSTQVYVQHLGNLVQTLSIKARELEFAPMLGRTHGQAAEPTDFTYRLLQFRLMAYRASEQMKETRRHLMVRKFPGAVGTSSIYDGTVDNWQVPSTQIISRDFQVEWATSCLRAVSVCEAIATEVRLLSRSEVEEVMEGGAINRTGSSAMPHKRNPIQSEKICGLARVARSYLPPIMDLVAQHHDRDLTNSSIERTVVPDLANLTGYLLLQTEKLVGELWIDKARMRRNLDEAGYRPYASLWVSLLQTDERVGYMGAHALVEDAFRHADPLQRLLEEMDADNLDTITFNLELEERMNPEWMTRNVR
jgi:adenylosuccinate lyase